MLTKMFAIFVWYFNAIWASLLDVFGIFSTVPLLCRNWVHFYAESGDWDKVFECYGIMPNSTVDLDALQVKNDPTGTLLYLQRTREISDMIDLFLFGSGIVRYFCTILILINVTRILHVATDYYIFRRRGRNAEDPFVEHEVAINAPIESSQTEETESDDNDNGNATETSDSMIEEECEIDEDSTSISTEISYEQINDTSDDIIHEINVDGSIFDRELPVVNFIDGISTNQLGACGDTADAEGVLSTNISIKNIKNTQKKN